MELFSVQKSALEHGIMFVESAQQANVIIWYETKEERDQAVQHLLETGTLEIKSSLSRLARSVNPYAFSPVDAPSTFYQRVSR